MTSQTLYEERLSSRRTEALFIVLTLVPLALLAWRVPSAGLDGWSVFLLVASAFFLFYSLNYRTLVIRVSEDALRLRFGLFEWTIPLQNIEACAPDTLTLWRIGGAGIHHVQLPGAPAAGRDAEGEEGSRARHCLLHAAARRSDAPAATADHEQRPAPAGIPCGATTRMR
jgi:hypothetical protein